MGSSDDPARKLGALLTGSEAREIAHRLSDDDTLTASLRVVPAGRRAEIRLLLSGIDRTAMIVVLRAIEGARSAPTTVDPLWTMPGHLARHGRLTQSVTYLVDNARYSVVCSTFNVQRSSGLWKALQRAARRPEITMKVYIDTDAADAGPRRPGSPTTDEVAAHLRPALILRTKRFDGRQVRNHAKFLSIDHRFLLVTSANFSWSAENVNLEFGVVIDNPNLAEAIERELREAEDFIFEHVRPDGPPANEHE
ncbi:DISARM system phospholipase D-like protein DrmC [Frankia sp. AgPm24]|uniref:DISARM system phospholipase D-like protein DrmC n=1 Tax=Frankia sp. AgPm24 TaxID=631128 RepID=UPI00200DE936|nr:DISARM system phospholipase D-like protein DrmC [Frankia sp. AgPm24]MCK9925120.1 DISARM system phospholipase D-like protein DrmC [Frankia sp. AgPm24]